MPFVFYDNTNRNTSFHRGYDRGVVTAGVFFLKCLGVTRASDPPPSSFCGLEALVVV